MNHREAVNFLPNDLGGRKGRRRSIAMGLAIVTLTASFSGGTIVRAYQYLQSTRRQLVAAEKSNETEAALLNAEHLRHEQQKKLIQRATCIATLIDTVPRSSILAELTNHLPNGASLVDVTLDTHAKPEAPSPEAKKTPADSRRKTESTSTPSPVETEVSVRITGLAETDLDVAHYLSELSRSPVFREVSLLISEEHRVSSKSEKVSRRFQMQMTVNPEAPLEPAPQRVPAVTAELDSAN